MAKCNTMGIDCPYKMQSEFTPVPCIATQEECDKIVKIKNDGYIIFIICSVRGASEEYRKKLEDYVLKLEVIGIKVHLPHRDTNQNSKGIEICEQNKNAIQNANEVHIFYNSSSQGTHFDMGMAFAFNKKIVVVENEQFGEGKSYPRMLSEWEKQ